MFASFLTTLLFALSAIFATKSARILGSIPAYFWRIVIATILLGLWAHSFGNGTQGIAFPYFVISGLIGFGLGDVALFFALPRLGSRLTILMAQCLAAPFAAMTEWLWLGTTLTIQEVLCGTTILLGVALDLAPGTHVDFKKPSFIIGIFFGFIAALGQAGGAVISRKAYQVTELVHESIGGITAAYQRALGGLMVAVMIYIIFKFFIFSRKSIQPELITGTSTHPWKEGWFLVFFNSLVGPTLGVSAYQWALETTPSGIVLPIVATAPLVILPFSYYLEGDRPGKLSILGSTIAVVGVIFLTLIKRDL